MDSLDSLPVVRLSNELAKKLKAVKDGTVLLFGWADESQIVCFGSIALDPSEIDDPSSHSAHVYVNSLISLLPTGFGLVGVYEFEQSKQEGRATPERILRSKLKYFLNSTLLAFVDGRLDEDGDVIRKDVRLFDPVSSEFCAVSESSVVNADSLLSAATKIRVCGKLPLTFETSNDIECLMFNVERSFDGLKEKILSPICAFLLQKSDVVLFNSNDSLSVCSAFDEDSQCGELSSRLQIDEEEDDGFQIKKQNKKNKKGAVNDSNFLNMDLLLKITGDDAVRQTVSCVPIIRYERKDFSSVDVMLAVDVVAIVSSTLPVATLAAILSDGVVTQLTAMKQCLCRFYKETNRLHLPKVYHFMLPELQHTVSVIYPDGLKETELEEYRKELHRKLMLPTNRPLLRKAMKHVFFKDVSASSYLSNVHVGLPPSGIKDGQQAIVCGSYVYHHYMQDRTNDNGWGCAYRSLQTLVSWFRCQGYTDEPVPTHSEIQQALVDIGDKPPSFVDSTNWIGSMEVSYCLDHLIGVSSKIIFVSSGSELASKARELIKHFQTQGTPIMIGGGVLAHTILGVDFDEKSGDVRYLILDPHYTGSEDLHTIQTKGWCGWKGTKFWDKTAYYNLCCPQRPSGV